MKLRRKWKEIFARAWSVRFTVLAGVFTAAEVALPLYAEEMPRGLFAALSGVAVVGALVARAIVQKDLSND